MNRTASVIISGSLESKMEMKKLRTPSFMVGLIVIILACNIPSIGATATATPSTGSGPPTEIPIQHTAIPISLPADRSSHAGDFDSSTTAASKQAAGGDRFTFAKFERPFNANTMDVYFSELDIVDTLVFQDDIWIYGVMTLKELVPSQGKYALELDLDLDGKGDWLIVASAPPSTDWTIDGVQAYNDANNDVGNQSAMRTDGSPTGDGFEVLVFDQGHGDDPDTSWVRISPDDANTVEISIKRSLLGDPERYLIGMWAGTSLLDPALFDLNDHFSHEQAGAADPGFDIFYPIKQISEIDNSCRMAVGFEPTGLEPGLCEVLIPVGAPGVPGIPGPTVCAQPPGCSGCGYTWDPSTCTCSQVAC
jgi:hypothetical protein